jgi:hypothetical protein
MGRRAFDKHFSEALHIFGLKCLGITSNNLARILHPQAMQLVKPVGNWLAVPSKWQFEGIVDSVFVVLVRLIASTITARVLRLIKQSFKHPWLIVLRNVQSQRGNIGCVL